MSSSRSAARHACRGVSRWALLSIVLPFLPGCLTGGLGEGETVVFFPTVAHRDADGDWIAPVNGWIYEPRLSDQAFLFFSGFLNLDQFVKTPEQQALLRQRLHSFIVDNKTGRRVEVLVAGRGVRLARSSDDGLFEDRLTLPAEAVASTRPESASQTKWIIYRTVARPNGKPFEGRIQLLEPTGLSVVSDIDDTIRVTEATNTKRMVENTFLKPFEPVPGMPAVYKHWAEGYGADFHYVSASPFQLYEPLKGMIAQTYPLGSIDLRVVRYEGNTLKYLLEMMDAPPEWKPARIEPIMQAFPQREFVFVGDSGQSDPEVYAQLARKYPQQVRAIFIRDITGEDPDAPRYQKTFEGLPQAKWRIFRKPEDIRDAIKPVH